MNQDSKTHQSRAQSYMEHHQPTTEKTGCFASLTPALAARFFLRTAIPIAFGLCSGMFSEWTERKIGMHDNNTLLEVSDFISCAATLLITYTIHSLLNCCWPMNPYHEINFFHLNSRDNQSSAKLLESGHYHAQTYS